MNILDDYPDSASCWIYAADRLLTQAQQQAVLHGLRPFLSEWTSHQQMVTASAAVLHDRFLVLVAVMEEGELSGCGIDKSVHRIEAAASQAGFGWASALDVLYRDEDDLVHQTNRAAFRGLVTAGTVRAATHVFDLGVTTLGALRNGAFELEAADAWHGRAFGIPSLKNA